MAATDPATRLAREQFYLSRVRTGRYLDRTLRFFPGATTVPTNFTGNLLLGGANGIGSDIINGITARPVVVPCAEIVVFSVTPSSFAPGDGIVVVSVTYSGADVANDIYMFFLPGTGTTIPVLSAISTGPDSVDLTIDVPATAIPGIYTLKILRAVDPAVCFGVRAGAVEILNLCTLTVTGITGDGVFPGPPILAGTLGNGVSLTGSGFLGGPLLVTITNLFLPLNPLTVTLVIVVDDMNLNVIFDAVPPFNGSYTVTVQRTDIPACSATIGFIEVMGV